MLVTETEIRRHQHQAVSISIALIAISLGLAWWLSPWWLIGIVLAGLASRSWTATDRRRKRLLAEPFADSDREILRRYVAFYRGLDQANERRFEDLMKVFLGEVTITGIRTDVDDVSRILIGASAIIPIFGLDDFEYAGLGEVLLYPDAFNADYQTDDATDRTTQQPTMLGMIGNAHLSGVMILSKPSLVSGFRNDSDRRNVGIHEFSHLIDKRDGDVDGIPATIPSQTIDPWVRWVGEELRGEGKSDATIDDYAYTNEAEYFAVLSEYFFESPALLQQKNPRLFEMMRKMYHQDPKQRIARGKKRPRRFHRNAKCPCGSGKKYKQCCRRS